MYRLAKSGRSSAIAAQRALFAERLARAQGYRTLQEWANGAILVSRTQFPVFAKMQCTLHGVQGKTADPSFIAHWRLCFPTLFPEVKELRADVEKGELVLRSLAQFARSQLARRMSAEAARRILAFCDLRCAWHEEQCTLAEFCAYLARDWWRTWILRRRRESSLGLQRLHTSMRTRIRRVTLSASEAASHWSSSMSAVAAAATWRMKRRTLLWPLVLRIL